MGKIDIGRVVIGGIVAGIVIDVIEFVLNGIVLANQWLGVMSSIHRPPLGSNEIIAFNILGLVQGLAAVWTYAAIRPRFGAGPKTAVYAAVLTWVTAYLVADALPTIMGVLPVALAVKLAGVGLVEIIVATVAGAYVYKEPS